MVEPLGNETLVHCEGDAFALVGSVEGSRIPKVDDLLSVSLKTSALHFFDDATGLRVE